LGLNATPGAPYRALLVAWWRQTRRPVARSHSQTVPSPQLLASSLPSGLNATGRDTKQARKSCPSDLVRVARRKLDQLNQAVA
jgi:hypothetical protein